jgi:hexosaminidase
VDYQVFPRLCATAEVLWSPKEGKDFDDFTSRLAVHAARLRGMGVQVASPTTRPVLIPAP